MIRRILTKRIGINGRLVWAPDVLVPMRRVNEYLLSVFLDPSRLTKKSSSFEIDFHGSGSFYAEPADWVSWVAAVRG